MNSVLGLFAKWPEPGKVKTRLARHIGPGQAAALALAMVQDTLAFLYPLKCSKILLFTPQEKQSDFSQLAGKNWQLRLQSAGDLGQRLGDFFTSFPGRTIAFGADSPTYPPGQIEKAFDLLQSSLGVLGPALDGGCCLIGYRDFQNSFLDQVPWSTNAVLESLGKNLQKAGIQPVLLPTGFDVDEMEDLHRLADSIREMKAANLDPLPQHTLAFLREARLIP